MSAAVLTGAFKQQCLWQESSRRQCRVLTPSQRAVKARTSDSDPTSSQVMSGVVVKPSRRTLGCTRAMAALKSPIVMARPLQTECQSATHTQLQR